MITGSIKIVGEYKETRTHTEKSGKTSRDSHVYAEILKEIN